MKHYFVDVWHADLDVDAGILSSLSAVLDDLEKQKADTYKLALVRKRYLAVRAISRHILASYLDADPATLQFTVGAHGKPSLKCNTLHFNISHSDHLLLMVVGNIPDLGIDIETIKLRSNLSGLARRCFTSTELNAWQALSSVQSLETFYRLWTKKEAFVKAVGRGIALGLDQCEVVCEVGGQLLKVPETYGLASDWKVTEIPVGRTVCAALITPECEFNLSHRQFVAGSKLANQIQVPESYDFVMNETSAE